MQSLKKNKKRLVVVFFIVFCLILIVNSCQSFNDKVGLEDDNLIEESLEELVEQKIEIDMDFTPRSPE